MNPFRTGQLVMFQVKYDRSWHFFEIIFYLILGLFGGLYGAFVMKWNLHVQAFRKKYLTNYPILEATTLAILTAIVCYPNMFLRIDMTESMEILFLECEGDHDYDRLCEYVIAQMLKLLRHAYLTQTQNPLETDFVLGDRDDSADLARHCLVWMQGSRRHFCSFYGHRCFIWSNGWYLCPSFARVISTFKFFF